MLIALLETMTDMIKNDGIELDRAFTGAFLAMLAFVFFAALLGNLIPELVKWFIKKYVKRMKKNDT